MNKRNSDEYLEKATKKIIILFLICTLFISGLLLVLNFINQNSIKNVLVWVISIIFIYILILLYFPRILNLLMNLLKKFYTIFFSMVASIISILIAVFIMWLASSIFEIKVENKATNFLLFLVILFAISYKIYKKYIYKGLMKIHALTFDIEDITKIVNQDLLNKYTAWLVFAGFIPMMASGQDKVIQGDITNIIVFFYLSFLIPYIHLLYNLKN